MMEQPGLSSATVEALQQCIQLQPTYTKREVTDRDLATDEIPRGSARKEL